MVVKPLIILLFCTILQGECAKILGVFNFPSKSHHILGSSLLKALAARGHEVTMLSPFPFKTPLKNYEDIELTGMLEFKEENIIGSLMHLQNASFFNKMSFMMGMVDKINERFLNDVAVKDLIASNRKFDLVIQSWVGNDAYLALPYLFEASSIVFSTVGSNVMTNILTANPAPFSYVPNLIPTCSDEMTFLERVLNTLSSIGSEIYFNWYSSPQQELCRQKYFPNTPPTSQLLQNVSLVFLNSHYSIESPRPYVPNMIQVGGLHVEAPKELKGDLKEFMDSAVEGVIFFSMGSNVRSSDWDKDKVQALIECFGKLPMKVLWKFETDDTSKFPSNVKTGKWLPQRDILAHPNTKLFVTHGGLLSTTEAIYHGVPMVGIPIFGDQDANVDVGVNNGYVIKVSYNDLSEATLTKAIKEALSNTKFRENVKQRSLILKDQPLKPIDKAVYWVEYVLRHKGAHHLKTSALKLQWYQYYLLDVLAFLIAIIFVSILAIYTLLVFSCKMLKKLFSRNTKRVTKETPNKKKKKSKMA